MRIRSSARARIVEPAPAAPRSRDPGTAIVEPPAGERMRELRAALVGRRGGGSMTLMVADPDRLPGAGRLAADLAVATARLGYRVLLVDANIARPELHLLFRLPNDRGVTDLTRGGVEAAPDIRETSVRGLSFLPAGPAVDDAAETIEGLHLADRLRRLGGRYDTIVVDVTAHAAPEAAAAAAGSDGVILAVRRDRTPIAAIRRTIAAFADRQVEPLGLVPVA